MSIRAIASAIVVAGTLGLGSASAMPLDALKSATEAVQQTENVRWVCGPYRCWWRPKTFTSVRTGDRVGTGASTAVRIATACMATAASGDRQGCLVAVTGPPSQCL